MAVIIGAKVWAIAEGYIPAGSHGPGTEPGRDFESHETACILNTNDLDAHIEIMVYYPDREPAGPYRLTVPARRTRHFRFNDLKAPEPIPKEKDYSSVIVSDVPVVVQYTRLDTRQAESALFSTVPYAKAA